MGTVTKSIGSASRDYSTAQAWEDALPANLVTDGNAQVGECYKDNGTWSAVAGTALTISGQTTDSTNNITIKCASGESFRDNANVQTNALRGNSANGVFFDRTTNYGGVFSISSNNVVIDGLMFGFAPYGKIYSVLCNGGSQWVKNCIIDGNADGTLAGGVLAMDGTSGKVTNTLLINRAASGTRTGIGATGVSTTLTVTNCTIVCPSDITASGQGFNVAYASNTPTITNTAVFGFSNFKAGSGAYTGSNNATDLASVGFGTSNQTSLTYTSQFQDTVAATRDFRIKSGATLIDNGVTDTSNGTPDIANTARPSGSAYDIGAWEYVSAAASFIWDGARAFTHMMVR